jgi:antitoxin (DNA-binding transcriptional repressor) of toxin-antitoxin stability system
VHIKILDVADGEMNLKQLLSMLVEGTEVILRKDGKPLARVAPIRQRIAGLNPGAIQAGKDFDEPLPEHFWMGKE